MSTKSAAPTARAGPSSASRARSPGLRERYQEISRYLQQAKLPFTVEFTYLEQGIRIRGQWYPILKMQWVEGFTLNEFVRRQLDKPAMLAALLQIWGTHGDAAAGGRASLMPTCNMATSCWCRAARPVRWRSS